MRVIAVGLLVALACPAAAGAARHGIAPAGNSAISQYVETIPTSRGNRPANTVQVGGAGVTRGGGSGGGGGIPALAPSTRQALAQRGADGLEAAALAQATAADGVQGAASTRSVKGEQSIPPDGLGRSSLSTVIDALTGSAATGGLGVLMPVLLVVSAVGGAVLAHRRHRRLRA